MTRTSGSVPLRSAPGTAPVAAQRAPRRRDLLGEQLGHVGRARRPASRCAAPAGEADHRREVGQRPTGAAPATSSSSTPASRPSPGGRQVAEDEVAGLLAPQDSRRARAPRARSGRPRRVSTTAMPCGSMRPSKPQVAHDRDDDGVAEQGAPLVPVDGADRDAGGRRRPARRARRPPATRSASPSNAKPACGTGRDHRRRRSSGCGRAAAVVDVAAVGLTRAARSPSAPSAPSTSGATSLGRAVRASSTTRSPSRRRPVERGVAQMTTTAAWAESSTSITPTRSPVGAAASIAAAGRQSSARRALEPGPAPRRRACATRGEELDAVVGERVVRRGDHRRRRRRGAAAQGRPPAWAARPASRTRAPSDARPAASAACEQRPRATGVAADDDRSAPRHPRRRTAESERELGAERLVGDAPHAVGAELRVTRRSRVRRPRAGRPTASAWSTAAPCGPS